MLSQYEEIRVMRDYGYTIDQISVLTGVDKDRVREVIQGVDLRIC